MSREKLSAFMDGELDAAELDTLMLALQQDEVLMDVWAEWQVASAVLQGEQWDGGSSRGMTGFSARLAAEPVVFSPRPMRVKASPIRRYFAPITVAVSVAFVGLAVWQISRPGLESAATVPLMADTELSLRAYLAAHQESEGNPFAGREVIYANFQPADAH